MVVGFCTVMLPVYDPDWPLRLYVTVTGTSPGLVLAAAAVTVTVADVVFVRLTFELDVVQLYVPPEGVPVAVRLMESVPVELAVRNAT